jgi:hypothetical protein
MKLQSVLLLITARFLAALQKKPSLEDCCM